MVIRKAQNQDLPAILNLMRQLIEEHRTRDKYYKPFSQYQDLKYYIRDAIADSKKILLVAEDHGAVLGYFIGAIEEAPYFSSEKFIGVVADTAVDKNHRRQGILKLFFQEARRWFQKKKITLVELSVDASNKAAVTAWKNLGFKDYKLRLRLNI